MKVLASFLSELEPVRTGGLCYSKQIRHCWLSLLTIAARDLDNIPDLCRIVLCFINSDPITTFATHRFLDLYQGASNHWTPHHLMKASIVRSPRALVFRSVLPFTAAWISHRCQWHTSCYSGPVIWRPFQASQSPLPRGRVTQKITGRHGGKRAREKDDFVADCVDFPLCFSVFAVYSVRWASQKWDKSRAAGEQEYLTLLYAEKTHGLFHVLLNFG